MWDQIYKLHENSVHSERGLRLSWTWSRSSPKHALLRPAKPHPSGSNTKILVSPLSEHWSHHHTAPVTSHPLSADTADFLTFRSQLWHMTTLTRVTCKRRPLTQEDRHAFIQLRGTYSHLLHLISTSCTRREGVSHVSLTDIHHSISRNTHTRGALTSCVKSLRAGFLFWVSSSYHHTELCTG